MKLFTGSKIKDNSKQEDGEKATSHKKAINIDQIFDFLYISHF